MRRREEETDDEDDKKRWKTEDEIKRYPGGVVSRSV